MDNFGRISYNFIEKEVEALELYFKKYKDKSTKNIPEKLVPQIYPDNFLSNKLYHVFPKLFGDVFEVNNEYFINELCLAGYFYFKYLIELDDLIDQDTNKHESIASLRANHYYFETTSILSEIFKENRDFWDIWRKRLEDFYKSILIDKTYNQNISIKKYESLAMGKCSFSLLAVDGLYLKSNSFKKTDIYNKLKSSLNFYFIARCLQDDFDDFFKDLKNRKNNYAHSLLFSKLDKLEINTLNLTPYQLESLFYEKEVAEEILYLSSQYISKANDEIDDYRDDLQSYVNLLKLTSVKINSIHGQSKYNRIVKNDLTESVKNNEAIDLGKCINKTYKYLSKKQRIDGAWEEVTNKQGVSDVWSTAFIAFFLEEKDPLKEKAINYLFNSTNKRMWGYNTEWLNDYDTSTFALLNTFDGSVESIASLESWLEGQQEDGGFCTYDSHNEDLKLFLGLSGEDILSGWGSSHPCVSAAALYLLTSLDKPKTNEISEQIIRYLKNDIDDIALKAYWWTSKIYTYYFYLKAIYRRNGYTAEIRKLLDHLFNDSEIFNGQFFVDDVLGKESIFYSGLVLDLLTIDCKIYQTYKRHADNIAEHIVKSQKSNGSFENTSFQIIPETNKSVVSNGKINFNSYGGTNSITGEFRSLFTNAVVFRALTNYSLIISE
jgi:hypothetical protein